MVAPVKTYRPSDIVVSISGFTLGGVVQVGVAFPTSKFKMIPGIRGMNTRVRNLDSSCILSIEILQTSITNDILTDIVAKDSVTGNGRLQVLVQDSSGTTKIQSENAYIQSNPDFTFSNDLNNKTWEIVMLSTVVTTVGGNSKARPQFLEDAFSFISSAASNVSGRVGDTLGEFLN